MTVQELIERLSLAPRDAIVFALDGDGLYETQGTARGTFTPAGTELPNGQKMPYNYADSRPISGHPQAVFII